MEFLYLLESIRNPVLDAFFSVVTHLGSEIVFLVLAVAVYWCGSKGRGLYLLTVGCLGTVVNQFLKLACRVPRPWIRDPNFTIVESARADAAGYSFPSGHTQNAVGTFGCLAVEHPQYRWLLIALAVLTAFSRMYLGVHTPADVGVSLLIAAVMVLALHPLFRRIEEKPEQGLYILGGLFLLNLAYVLYVSLWQFPADVDGDNLTHGVENAYKLLGAILGMAVGYAIDLKWVRFQTKAPLSGQVLKLVLGLGLLLVLKEGLKPVLGDGYGSDALRYGLMTVFAGGIWPMTFGFFAKLGKKA